ncbi:DUF500-domain-containing protein [Panus rudis PR-1116 ss-1]|nr:DUF500-domain-containing protein [Panus rudis PR-1116 ss-1]
MKFNTPLPQPLPKECIKAAKIFKSFVDSGNNGLDGVIPRNILENAKGFAIFTIFKAGFLFSARAGSGVVIAKLEDGTWSAPSAIGTAGLGVGGQAGAEMTDFLVVLNSRSAVRQFMAAGSLTLGGNLSIAVGPLGRNGEAIGALNSSGKVAAMYSYSKTRGLFGGVSVEGSVIVERQDANAQAYHSDVTAKMLLSGAVPPPEWAMPLIKTLEACTGLPGNHRWVQDFQAAHSDSGYLFSGFESPRNENGPSSADGKLKKKNERPGLIHRTSSSSYFDFSRDGSPRQGNSSPKIGQSANDKSTTAYFTEKFESDFVPEEELRKHPKLKTSPTAERFTSSSSHRPNDDYEAGSPFNSLPPFQPSVSRGDSFGHRRAVSSYVSASPSNPFSASHSHSNSYGGPVTSSSVDYLEDLDGNLISLGGSSSPPPKLAPKVELTKPLRPDEGVARAIALFDFNAVQPGDLSFKKGQVITVTQMSDTRETWWTGKLEGREGMFPANFVEVV